MHGFVAQIKTMKREENSTILYRICTAGQIKFFRRTNRLRRLVRLSINTAINHINLIRTDRLVFWDIFV